MAKSVNKESTQKKDWVTIDLSDRKMRRLIVKYKNTREDTLGNY